MRRIFGNVLLFMLGLLPFGWLSVNLPPAPNPIVRAIITPWTKRVHAKVLSGCAFVRQMFATLVAFVNRLGNFSPQMARAGTLNMFMEPLPTFPYQFAALKENMPRSVYIRDLLVSITGTLTVSGGTADGTLQTDPIARLIREFRIRWDGIDLIAPIHGRDLAALGRRLVGQTLTGVPVTSPGVQVTNFDLRFFVPFARSYLADPFDTVLPPLQVKKEFIAQIQYETARSNAVVGTTDGSRAFVVGGDRVVALTNVVTTITPRVARNAGAPMYIPQIAVYETKQFSAADTKLKLDLTSPESFDAMLIRTLGGAEQDAANLLTDLTLQSKSVKILEKVTRQELRMMEEDVFFAVQNSSEVGTHMIRFADGGKLGNAINPAELTLPELLFNVTVPSNPGVVRVVVMELLKIQGITRD